MKKYIPLLLTTIVVVGQYVTQSIPWWIDLIFKK